jgi:hypothetical protein
MAGGMILPPSIERLWLGELRRAHAIINIISTGDRVPQEGRIQQRVAWLFGPELSVTPCGDGETTPRAHVCAELYDPHVHV